MSLGDDEHSLEAMLEVINDESIGDIDARLSAPPRLWRPPSIDDLVTFGKYKDKAWSYRELAANAPGYAKWAAANINGLRGQLCAEALAEHLGVNV